MKEAGNPLPAIHFTINSMQHRKELKRERRKNYDYLPKLQ